MSTLTIQITSRQLALILAGIMSSEDAPDAFRVALEVLGEPNATDKEIVDLGDCLVAEIIAGRRAGGKP